MPSPASRAIVAATSSDPTLRSQTAPISSAGWRSEVLLEPARLRDGLGREPREAAAAPLARQELDDEQQRHARERQQQAGLARRRPLQHGPSRAAPLELRPDDVARARAQAPTAEGLLPRAVHTPGRIDAQRDHDVLDVARAFGEGEVVVQDVAAARLHERAVERVGHVVDDLRALERRIAGEPAAPAQHAVREPGVTVEVVEAPLAHLALRAGRRVDARHAEQLDLLARPQVEPALTAVPVAGEDHVLSLDDVQHAFAVERRPHLERLPVQLAGRGRRGREQGGADPEREQVRAQPTREIRRAFGSSALQRAEAYLTKCLFEVVEPQQGQASGLAEGGLGPLPRQLGATNDVREAGLPLDGRDPGMAHERVPARIARVHGPAEDLRRFRHAEPRGLRADEEDLLGVEGPVEVPEHGRAARLGQREEVTHGVDPLPHHGRLRVVGRGHRLPGLDGLLPATERQEREGPRRHAFSIL